MLRYAGIAKYGNVVKCREQAQQAILIDGLFPGTGSTVVFAPNPGGFVMLKQCNLNGRGTTLACGGKSLCACVFFLEGGLLEGQ